MTLMKTLNDFFKKNLKEIQIGFEILMIIYIWNYLSLSVSRAGLTSLIGGFNIFSIVLLVIAIVLIVIPEPATTMTGFMLGGVALLLLFGGNFLADLFQNYGIWIIVAIVVFIFFQLRSRRPSYAAPVRRARPQVIVINRRQGGNNGFRQR